MKPLTFTIRNRTIACSWYPIVLCGIHLLLFLWINPKIDLPIYDDANYFAHAIMASSEHATIYGDWSPLLLYFAKLLYWILPFSKLTIYFVYRYCCELICILGMYCFIVHFTKHKEWAFWLTIILTTTISLPFIYNVHKYNSGLVMLFLIALDRMKRFNLWLGVGIVILSLLLRWEYIILTGGLVAWYAWNNVRSGSVKAMLQPSLASLSLLIFSILLWLPVFMYGQMSTDRLMFAFGEKFQLFAQAEGMIEAGGLPPNAHYNVVLDHFFPPEQRRDSFPFSLSPILSIASANPTVFKQFIWANTKPFRWGVFSFSESEPLAAFISILCVIGFFIFLGQVVMHRKTESLQWIYFSLIFAISIVPTFITYPNRIYLIPAIAWFAGVIPSFWLTESRYLRSFLIAFFVVTIYFQYFEWHNYLIEEMRHVNRHRAIEINDAYQYEGFEHAVIAEAYPQFSVAYCDGVDFSCFYDVGWDNNGILRNGYGTGIVVQYLLIERPPASHAYFDKVDDLLKLGKDYGKLISEVDGYSMWRIDNIALRIYDTLDPYSELHDMKDSDPSDQRELVLRWELREGNLREFHIWVAVDGGEPKYLGITRDPNDRDFDWAEGKEEVHPDFADGPQFGHRYEFIVYGIPVDWNPANANDETKDKPKPIYSRGAIEYVEETP